VISHVVMGIAFVLTGLTTDFVPLVLTQVLWGVGWTFTSGADVAWITDELDDHERVDRIVAARARWQLLAGMVGMALSGVIAWAFDLSTAIVVAGVGMGASAIFVMVAFTEHRFTPVTEDHFRAAMKIFREGVSLARRDSQILLVLGATLTLNSGAEAVDRLFNRRLVDLGFPDSAETIAWFTALGIVGVLAGALALRVIESRIDEQGAPRRFYLYGAGLAVVGTLVLAWAPNVWVGVAGTFVVRGVAWAIIPAVASIWVHRRTSSGVRATVHSFLGQAESVGEITGGMMLGAVAQWSTLPLALTGSAGLFLLTFVIVSRSRAGRAEQVEPAVV